ncbi:heavy metal sensor histidine kinase [Halopseudomonas sp.]|uniref:heavy metal sensor histidine kinase n=1 Tax=Halopseudomonas sp. TaxID=2901191 RepID=UPI001A3C19D9|nr:heavy metal sensor histidine kinase [Pseudomonas sp.]|tara:strand:- start:7173 stop:8558 length:1386 start_codon:yes stop_codon:yes gene_type:complete
MSKALSLSLRIGLSISLLGSILVVLIFSQSWWTLKSQLEKLADIRLEQKLEQLIHTLNESTSAYPSSFESHALTDLVTGHPDLGLLVCDVTAPRRTLFAIGNVPAELITGSCLDLEKGRQKLRHAGVNLQARSSALRVGDSKDKVFLILFSNRSDDATLLAAYRDSTLLTLPVFLMIIGVGAWWIVRRGLAPLGRFEKLASIVSARDLRGRIEPSGLPMELSALAVSINVMLERLENEVQQLSDFSDDLAHELRSPITNLLGKAQVTLSRDRTSLQYKETLESCVEELGRISRIVSDMLYLAQAVQAETGEFSERISLGDEALHVVNLFSFMAEDKDVTLTVKGTGTALGDRLMVQRAISNLLSNAIRHASQGTNIPLVISKEGQSVVLSVTNSGPGIPEEQTEAVFKRFYRVDQGRSREEGGTGLGLSIVSLIMKAHQGNVTVISSEAGPTTFNLWFKLV